MITVDVVEGIIDFADKHRKIDKQDIAAEIVMAEDHGFVLDRAEAADVVDFLECRLVDGHGGYERYEN